MPLSFTAIDFETANARRGSICSVGLTKVTNGVVTASTSWLITPPDGAGLTTLILHPWHYGTRRPIHLI
jgi:DNA polymerase-3 subunit epsilon